MKSARHTAVWISRLTLATASLAASCGGSQAPAESATEAPTEEPASSPSPSATDEHAVPEVWSEEMSGEQKGRFMQQRVVPAMGEVFREADPARHTAFGCKTCHGPAYKEPTEYLPALTMKDGQITAFAEKPEVAKFMAERVVPAMAKAMGMQPYDPATNSGFGCSGCHSIKTE